MRRTCLNFVLFALLSAASAGVADGHAIEYTIYGYSTASVTYDGTTTNLPKLPYRIEYFGDTSTFTTDAADDDYLVTLTSGVLIGAGGVSHDIALPSSTYFATVDAPGADEDAVVEGAPTDFQPISVIEGRGLAGFKGDYSVGPVGILLVSVAPLTLASGAVVTFKAFSLAAFSSYVPEPAAWALMAIGVGAVGVTLRRRRAFTVS
jgi:hypothetical protein